MKKIVLFISLLLMQYVFLNQALATVFTGNDFLEQHQAANKVFINGYMAGIWDSLEPSNPALIKCVGTEVKMSQLADTVAIYLKNNPQMRHYSVASIAPIAISTQFRCK
ncbi:Rap1a/Tai family immunity protein [Polynucleobacter sphagniphilus]|jgi:hypothetical protein|uniref:Rap1a immunity protein domain-containing protein n=1 Tax=Polynucleobacter sphagniphilus TaxID=1743169 RepID=A0AA43S4L9_9BURK|nr:Rap1a/Tai family immunity protein [Polynucleobacter sphagniphilus]MDH6502943.1 hypothetical protein [Polynucleobacter sphagniphilus]MDH6511604.1 hypothetical protein [Polynucleobacter sphagniphilus]